MNELRDEKWRQQSKIFFQETLFFFFHLLLRILIQKALDACLVLDYKYRIACDLLESEDSKIFLTVIEFKNSRQHKTVTFRHSKCKYHMLFNKDSPHILSQQTLQTHEILFFQRTRPPIRVRRTRLTFYGNIIRMCHCHYHCLIRKKVFDIEDTLSKWIEMTLIPRGE